MPEPEPEPEPERKRKRKGKGKGKGKGKCNGSSQRAFEGLSAVCASERTRGHARARLSRRCHDSETAKGVAMPESTESFIEAEAAGYTWVRRPPVPADDHVLGHTDNWLNALPKGARPVHLQNDFPRIANDLARLWPATAELDRYFENLEFSPRNDRSGFPLRIKEELLAMHVYSLRHRPVSYEEQALRRAVHEAAILG